jgi:hypothetical protein
MLTPRLPPGNLKAAAHNLSLATPKTATQHLVQCWSRSRLPQHFVRLGEDRFTSRVIAGFPWCKRYVQNAPMIPGYVQVSMNSRRVAPQVADE